MESSRGVFGRVTICPLLWRKVERPAQESHGYTIIFQDRNRSRRFSGLRQTAAAGARRAEYPVPEAGADAEIAGIVIVMRQVAHSRLVHPIAGLDLPVMGGVVNKHITSITGKRPDGEPGRCY